MLRSTPIAPLHSSSRAQPIRSRHHECGIHHTCRFQYFHRVLIVAIHQILQERNIIPRSISLQPRSMILLFIIDGARSFGIGSVGDCMDSASDDKWDNEENFDRHLHGTSSVRAIGVRHQPTLEDSIMLSTCPKTILTRANRFGWQEFRTKANNYSSLQFHRPTFRSLLQHRVPH